MSDIKKKKRKPLFQHFKNCRKKRSAFTLNISCFEPSYSVCCSALCWPLVSSSSAVGGFKVDSCVLIGCSRRRLPWHSGCCTESVPQHQQPALLHPLRSPSLLLSFLLLTTTTTTLALSSLSPSSYSSSPRWNTGRKSSTTSSRRTGRCAEACLSLAAQARHCVLLWSPSRTIYLRSVRVCVMRAGI